MECTSLLLAIQLSVVRKMQLKSLTDYTKKIKLNKGKWEIGRPLDNREKLDRGLDPDHFVDDTILIGTKIQNMVLIKP